MKKILFIEDEPSLQEAVVQILKVSNPDIQVFSALDGEAGLQVARQEKPNLILLDLILPKKGGIEVLKELRTDDITKDIPVIVLTNLETPEHIQEVLSLGATTYLIKANYKLQEIQQKIEDALK